MMINDDTESTNYQDTNYEDGSFETHHEIGSCCSRVGLIHPLESTGIVARLKEELRLAKAQILHYVFYLFVCGYGGSTVFRNLAFYRYPDYVNKSSRLRDLGFEIIPQVTSDKIRGFELTFLIGQIIITVSVLSVSLFGNV